ncbi:MAG: hypothetical protein IRZ16_17025 [Myxococcaceae bacterium]|nr:hypothetical protein [Myxococcaceae bacterium]
MNGKSSKDVVTSALAEIEPLVSGKKRRAATDADLAKLGRIHPDLRALYRWCKNLDAVFSSVEEGFEWLDVKSASANLRMLRDAGGDDFPATLVPIAGDGAGNFRCHDTKTGRVVDWDHETRKTARIAPDLDAYLRKHVLEKLVREKKERESLDALKEKAPLVAKRAPVRPTKIAKVPRADLSKLDREGYAGGACGAMLLDGERVLLGFQNLTQIWDLKKQKAVAEASTDSIGGVTMHEGTGRILSVSHETLILSDAELKPIALWEAHDDRIWDVRFSPDGKTAATCGADRSIRLWDVASLTGIPRELPKVRWDAQKGKPFASFSGHGDIVEWCAFSPDGKTLASGGWDKTVRLWDVAKRKPLWNRKEHSGRVMCGAFSPDGNTIATGGESKNVVLFDPRGAVVHRWKADQYGVRALAFVSNELLLTLGTKLALWELPKGKLVASIEAPKENSNPTRLSVRGSLVLTTGRLALHELR